MSAPAPVAATRLHGAPLVWLRMRAVARRHAYVLARSPHRLFDVTLWPLVDALLFGALAAYIGGGHASTGGHAAGYLVAGIVLWHVVYQSQISVSTGLLEETWSRNLLNLMVTPLREVEYVGGVALFGMLKLAMGVGVVALGALVFYSFDVSTLGFGLVPIAAVLLLVGWTIALFVIGVVLRFGSGAEALAWGVMFVVMPLSGIFYPVASLPGPLQPVSQALPTTHAFAALRGLVDGNALAWSQIGIATAETAAFAALALWFLVRMLRIFRRRGYITRFT
ncbi:MAG: ABC transporter permease [Acidimicrobiia bacterium]